MQENKTTKINVAQILSKTISSRDVLVVLIKKISSAKEKIVELDFSEVDFISRSAAHELLKIREDFDRKKIFKKNVMFVNQNKDVSQMLRLVAANFASPQQPKPKLKTKIVDIHSFM